MRPRQPALGDPLRGHLQRADHRRADPARAPRRALPRPVGAAVVLRRNLLDLRRSAGSSIPFIGIKLIDVVVSGLGVVVIRRQLVPAVLVVRRVHRADRRRVPARRDRHRPGRVPGPGGRVARRARRRRRRLAADRAVASPARSTSTRGRPQPETATTRCRAPRRTSGPTNQDLLDAVLGARRCVPVERTASPPDEKVPVDAVTSSGSGLDPHISPANARLQALRVARERGLSRRRGALARRRAHGRALARFPR